MLKLTIYYANMIHLGGYFFSCQKLLKTGNNDQKPRKISKNCQELPKSANNDQNRFL